MLVLHSFVTVLLLSFIGFGCTGTDKGQKHFPLVCECVLPDDRGPMITVLQATLNYRIPDAWEVLNVSTCHENKTCILTSENDRAALKISRNCFVYSIGEPAASGSWVSYSGCASIKLKPVGPKPGRKLRIRDFVNKMEVAQEPGGSEYFESIRICGTTMCNSNY